MIDVDRVILVGAFGAVLFLLLIGIFSLSFFFNELIERIRRMFR